MDKLIVKGPGQLSGSIKISKAKNAFLPILAASLLTDEKIVLNDVPDLRDIRTMLKLLETLGVKINHLENNSVELQANAVTSFSAPYELVKTMRASICVLGPLLTRFSEAKVSLPGGCAIGTRPIDFHLEGLKQFGTNYKIEGGYVDVRSDNKKLMGCKITLPFPSVGATQNLIMAAVLAQGKSVIKNVAKEPEVTDLINFLISMGAQIKGVETSEITVQGVEKLSGTNYTPIGDRIEAGTYIIAAIMTQSQVKVKGFDPDHLEFPIQVLKESGAKLERIDDGIEVFPSKLKGFNVDTAPYPGFPTDLQAQFMALATSLSEPSTITENIFENRFMHVPELKRLGARIKLKDKTAIIHPAEKFVGAPVMCTDLRASAAILLAALISEGESIVQRVYHLDRGYEKIDQKLKQLGVNIRRVNEGD